MKNSLIKFLIWFFLVICFINHSSSTWAEEKTIQWKEFFYSTEGKNMQVQEGHNIGILDQKGLAVFDNEEFALLETWFTYENIRGKSTYQGYVLYTFKDGSTKFAKIEGSGKVPGQQKGTVVFIKGTGRFEGIQGEGSFTAWTPFMSEGAETYVDATATYIVTSK
jgi:hypothetical protein